MLNSSSHEKHISVILIKSVDYIEDVTHLPVMLIIKIVDVFILYSVLNYEYFSTMEAVEEDSFVVKA
ncbi:hypothetical protein MAR_011753 [Mya arenaria]|uniref:Uncharacterized protein n=1 Tax=Mya arenaria TaxID=6604 RepID=A0ABY7FY09_MYAAR|nr:hypothetical protein MAR_011753 [Mya arenaria]